MAKEFLWGCELNSSTRTVVWDMLDVRNSEEAANFNFTLLVKTAILGSSSAKDDVNVVQLDTTSIMGEPLTQPLFRLTRGICEQITLELMVCHPGSKFRLIEGKGPVYLWGQHLVEWATEDDSRMSMLMGDNGEEEADLENDEEVEEEQEEDEIPEPLNVKSKSTGTKKRSNANAEDSERLPREDSSTRRISPRKSKAEYLEPESLSESEVSKEEEKEDSQKPPGKRAYKRKSKAKYLERESLSESEVSEEEEKEDTQKPPEKRVSKRMTKAEKTEQKRDSESEESDEWYPKTKRTGKRSNYRGRPRKNSED